MTPDVMRRLPLEAAALRDWLDAGCGVDAAPVKGVVALLPAAQAEHVPLLQQLCRQAGVTLLGGLFPRLIDGAELVEDGAWLLALPQAPAGFLLPSLADDPRQAGDALAAAAQQAVASVAASDEAARSTLLLIFDGQLTRIGSLVEQAYLQLDGRLRLLGINAGSDSFAPLPCLFDAEHFTGGGVVGLLLPDTVRGSLSLQPARLDELYTVTASSDNRVASINARPAFEVYRELVARDYGIALTAGNFYRHAVHYPLAIARGDGQVLYRIPVKLEDDGAITCIGEIPQYSLLSVQQAPAPEDMHCVAMLARSLQPQRPGGQLLAFYCAGRQLRLGEAANAELVQLQQQLQPACQAGALVLGEIGNTNNWGYPLFYNGALVGLGWDLAG